MQMMFGLQPPSPQKFQSIIGRVILPRVSKPSGQAPTNQQLVAQLKQLVNQKYSKMVSHTKETPELVIPKAFTKFIDTPLFYQFLAAIYDYTMNFQTLNDKYNTLNKKLEGRLSGGQSLLQHELHSLATKQKQIFSSKNAHSDVFFFETLVYLTCRVMSSFFSRADFVLVEQEINRLFRTQKYNIIKKRHQKDRILRQYPILKEQPNKLTKMNITSLLTKAQDRSRVLDRIQQIIHSITIQFFRKQKRRNQSQHKANQTISFGAAEVDDKQQRSPILSVFLPSNKHRLQTFKRGQSMKMEKLSWIMQRKGNVQQPA